MHARDSGDGSTQVEASLSCLLDQGSHTLQTPRVAAMHSPCFRRGRAGQRSERNTTFSTIIVKLIVEQELFSVDGIRLEETVGFRVIDRLAMEVLD